MLDESTQILFIRLIESLKAATLSINRHSSEVPCKVVRAIGEKFALSYIRSSFQGGNK